MKIGILKDVINWGWGVGILVKLKNLKDTCKCKEVQLNEQIFKKQFL